MPLLFDYSLLIPRNDKEPINGPSNCKLLDDFAIIIQLLMGCIAVSTLLFKRTRETPQRPFKIWAFDVSKQIIGGMTVHFLNILVSLIVGASLETSGDSNPCVWYFLNILVDTTIGVGMLYGILKLLEKITFRFGIRGMETGHYGTPPQWDIWARQTVVFVIGLFIMKCFVLIMLKIFPFLFDIGEWMLGWTKSNLYVQVIFVMLVFPLTMNILQFWIVDNILRFNDKSTLNKMGLVNVTDEESFLVGEGESDDENDLDGKMHTSIQSIINGTSTSSESGTRIGAESRGRSREVSVDIIKLRHTPPLENRT